MTMGIPMSSSHIASLVKTHKTHDYDVEHFMRSSIIPYHLTVCFNKLALYMGTSIYNSNFLYVLLINILFIICMSSSVIFNLCFLCSCHFSDSDSIPNQGASRSSPERNRNEYV